MDILYLFNIGVGRFDHRQNIRFCHSLAVIHIVFVVGDVAGQTQLGLCGLIIFSGQSHGVFQR